MGGFGPFGVWLFLVLAVAGSILVAVGSVWLATGRLSARVGKEHNPALAPFVTTVGLVYGALLGFTVVVAWEQFSSAAMNVANEASTLTTMYRQTVGMPAPEQTRMRELLRTYTSAVAGPRILDTRPRIPWLLWVGLIFGGVLLVALMGLIHLDSRRAHAILSSSVAALLGLLLFIVFCLDHPFGTQMGVTPAPLEQSIQVFDATDRGT